MALSGARVPPEKRCTPGSGLMPGVPGRQSLSVSRGYSIGMNMQAKSLLALLAIFFILLSAGIAGCTSQSPAPAGNISAVEPSQVILQASDLPANFSVIEKGERNVSEMRSWALDHGWKKGSYALYLKNDPASLPGTVITQTVSVYPAQNISLIVPDTVNIYKNWTIRENDANLTFEEIPLSTIGDSSRALKITDRSDNTQMYLISFVKKDVYQYFWTNGTAADYETAKQLAGIAAAKIR